MGRTTHNVFWYYHISYMILFPYFTLIFVWRIEVFFSGREGPPTSYFGRRENLLDLSTSAVQPYYPEPPRLYSFHMMLEVFFQNNRGSLLCILLIENLIPHHEQCAVAAKFLIAALSGPASCRTGPIRQLAGSDRSEHNLSRSDGQTSCLVSDRP